MVDFAKRSQEFKDLIKSIGVEKVEIENIVTGGKATIKEKESIFKNIDDAMKKLSKLMADTEVTAEERKRRVTELQSEIDRIMLIKAFESDFEERMRLNRKLSRLSATLATWEAMDVFHFETLLDPEGQDFKTLLEEADKDIKARQNLQRVLKGVEVVFRVGAFGASLAAKMAAAVVS